MTLSHLAEQTKSPVLTGGLQRHAEDGEHTVYFRADWGPPLSHPEKSKTDGQLAGREVQTIRGENGGY